ncbi:MAG: threonine synthase [Erysipelotrichaceae bacterium]|nr:threonine synthase [Erysipelotrichaceae bacterium]
MTRYISTRNKEDSLSAHEAVIAGLAKDGGLYTPESIDVKVPVEEILNDSYQECAAKIIRALLDDYTEEEIHDCVYGAYDSKFDTEKIVPLKQIRGGWLMELWHGPTSAFKDIALTILPRLLTAAYKKENRNDIVSILTATSGDTGKAALSGFADVPHTAITVFYPEIGVSPIQKKQMATSRGDNVEVIAVKGNFDDCQRMVKEAVSSKEVLDACYGVTISSANSINIGRLVPQIVYYYYSYAQLVNNGTIDCGDPVNFVVPTGNFGDILAGYLAKQIGLPVRKLICASNSNNVLTDFLATGVYSLDRRFLTTMSPSMDILISSNLERLLFMLSGNNDIKVSAMMDSLKAKGSYRIDDVMLKKIRETFSGYWTNEEQCALTIHDLFVEQNVLIDPHTAVGVSAMERYQKETGDYTPAVVLSTASPYKFCRDVYFSITGEKKDDDFEAMDALEKLSGVKVPANLAELKDMKVRFTRSIEKEDGLHVIAERMRGLGNAQN